MRSCLIKLLFSLLMIVLCNASQAQSQEPESKPNANAESAPPAKTKGRKFPVKTVKAEKPEYIQPGDQVVADAIARNVTTVEQAQKVMREVLNRDYYAKLPMKLPKVLDPLAAKIILSMVNDNSMTEALTEQISNQPTQGIRFLRASFILFPIDRYELINDPALHALIEEDRVRLLAVEMGVDPSDAFPAPAAGVKEPVIQPLIESASITLFNEPVDAEASVRFKKTTKRLWSEAHDLYYEPSRGTLTGSIVNLKQDKEYNLEITFTLHGKEYKQEKYKFRTWPDTPPIDPEKVYYLKDIYKGGMLDLEKLGIEGKEGAWAKIVGDPATPIIAGDEFNYGINIGKQNYIYLENVIVKRGGRRHGIRSYRAHHIWLNGCDIAQWGRIPNVVKNGISYESKGSNEINYDAGLYLRETGVIVVENCHIHDPVPDSNTWDYGHPKGSTAFFAHANHPQVEYRGQVVLRNNLFEGKPGHRLNDVVEGRSNGSILGGFVRDSAIYNNVFRYSNDDCIEIDGGQSNVLVYNNDISHCYVGISVIPNRLGPSYVFNNYIHDLGDESGSQWTAIKAGGLVSGPIGLVNIFNNFITVARNGISASDFKDDRTFWVNAVNNVIITENNNEMVGYGIYDLMKYSESKYINNYIYNLSLNSAKYNAEITEGFHDKTLLNTDFARSLFESDHSTSLNLPDELIIENFSQKTDDGGKVVFGLTENIAN